jgi:hypothetical protein
MNKPQLALALGKQVVLALDMGDYGDQKIAGF